MFFIGRAKYSINDIKSDCHRPFWFHLQKYLSFSYALFPHRMWVMLSFHNVIPFASLRHNSFDYFYSLSNICYPSTQTSQVSYTLLSSVRLAFNMSLVIFPKASFLIRFSVVSTVSLRFWVFCHLVSIRFKLPLLPTRSVATVHFFI